jgi:hypothetical protein
MHAEAVAPATWHDSHLYAIGIVGAGSLQHAAQQGQLQLEGDQVVVLAVAHICCLLEQDILQAEQAK